MDGDIISREKNPIKVEMIFETSFETNIKEYIGFRKQRNV